MGIFLFMCLLLLVASDCPIGWIYHGDSCYHYSHDKESWEGAFAFCKIVRGYLVEINSEGELKYIDDQVKLLGGEYLWMNSMERVSYTHWGPGQPDNTNKNENCVEIHAATGYWNDLHCSELLNYICEVQPRSEPVVG